MRIEREPAGTFAHHVKTMALADVRESLGRVEFKTAPFEHQLRGVLIGMCEPGFLFCNDMGTGKTKIVLDIITLRKRCGDMRRALVVAPPIVLRHWEAQVREHSDLSVRVVEGSSEGKVRLFAESDADVTVCSTNWLTRWFQRDADMALARRYDCLVIDEAHCIKNPMSKIFRGIGRYFAAAPYRYLLTGTPVGNDLTAVYSLYCLVDLGDTFGRSYRKFLEAWFNCVQIRPNFRKCSLRKDRKEDFLRLFWRRAVRWEEAECNDLPAKIYDRVPVEMHPDQREAYEAAVEAAEASEDASRKSVEMSLFGLMRITAGIGFEASAKVEATMDLVHRLCITGKEQAIIWCWLQDEARMLESKLAQRFPRLRVGAVRGGTGDARKAQVLADWRKGKVRLLLANQKSLGVGVDLFEARACIFFSNSFSLIDRKQSEKRIHRAGQSRRVLIFDVTARRSVDELILGTVRGVSKQFDELTRDNLWKNLRRYHEQGDIAG